MDDGKALLLALVRRKGSPHALADWLLERAPTATEYEPAVLIFWRSGNASVRWLRRIGSGVWVELNLRWAGTRTTSHAVHIDLTDPHCGRWLAYYLNTTFIRRPERKAKAPVPGAFSAPP